MTDLDTFLTTLVAQVAALPTRVDPGVRVLAADENVSRAIATVINDAGGIALDLTLPTDLDDALTLIEHVLPGADLLVIAADVSDPIREALDVIADVCLVGSVIEPAADTAWGFVGDKPLIIVPSDAFEALVATHLVVAPAVRARGGEYPVFRPARAVNVDNAIDSHTKARRFVPGRRGIADAGVVSPLPELRDLAAADVLLVIPPQADVQPGDRVAALDLAGNW